MAHVVMSAQMNVDIGFYFDGMSSKSIGPFRLIRIQSMEQALLSSFSLLGINVNLGLDYGVDIRQDSW